MKLTFNTVARDICRREKSDSREVNITDVKRVMRHFFDIMQSADEAWLEAETPKPVFAPSICFLLDETEKRQARKSRRPDKKGR